MKELKQAILNGDCIKKEQAMSLIDSPLDTLISYADEIRKYFCGDTFDICTIINAKSGKCSEDCKYCAQSSFYKTDIMVYPLLEKDTILNQARYNDSKGVLRFSLVTSGKRLSNKEVDDMCDVIRDIKSKTNINVCVSFGLLDFEQFVKLKQAGITRVHNNLESSKNFFSNICTTHTFDDKISSIKDAHKAGLNVCSGGIMGLGESMEDRIDMAFSLKEIGIRSVPINILNPIQNTPYQNNSKLTTAEMQRIVAIYRFILPNASIRLAGGRGMLPDKGESCFTSGANAAISGDMLTTAGITIETDMRMLKNLGYKVELQNE